MTSTRILIIDDDQSIRTVLGYILEEAGYVVDKAANAARGLDAIRASRPDLVLSDVKMPQMDGITLLGEIKSLDPTIPVIILTAFGTVETAVEAMKRGAADYLTKPVSRDELTITVAKTLRLHHLEVENADLRDSLRDRYRFENIIGFSPSMTQVFDSMDKVAATDVTVLINGESGTGKELVAKAIHYHSARRSQRLVTVNCAAIPHELLESELFGHVRGAFTGAVQDKVGKFEQAQGGSVFLDEIGSMPITLQAKLLRVLQEREVERIGDDKPIAIDVRIIAATNRSLSGLIEEGSFREDLYYRLNVVPIEIPPLRSRAMDIPPLVRHFTERFRGDAPVRFTEDAIDAMLTYSWPGNVRELGNFCERVILMRTADVIDRKAVSSHLAALTRESPATTGTTLGDIERRAVIDALRSCQWNQSQAARALGVPRHVLLYRLKKYNIDITRERRR